MSKWTPCPNCATLAPAPDIDHPKAVVCRLLHADAGFKCERVLSVHREDLIQPNDVRARSEPLQSAHDKIALHHAGSVRFGVKAIESKQPKGAARRSDHGQSTAIGHIGEGRPPFCRSGDH
ncbi:MAG: hypothetical protein AB7F41_04905 [Methylocystis sp.]|uniref:hypothetical protein n=1 Tax=Methylocystis sp. TaxID=1911079 RepID=UPI003D0E105A